MNLKYLLKCVSILDTLKYFFIVLLFFGIVHSNYSQQLAFPTASGAGAYTSGGRGYPVVIVSSLNDSGPGTLRDAFGTVMNNGGGIITFSVSGTIKLESVLTVVADNFTLAGQTAPAGGITIAGNKVSFQNANNFIMRYIRFRPEYFAPGNVDDGTRIINSTNYIIDHCSFSWGRDEVVSTTQSSHSITWQNNIIAEGKTGTLFGDSNNPELSYDLSFHNNLYYNITHRFPNVSSNGRADVINNVIFNWKFRLSMILGEVDLNHINNYYSKGCLNDVTDLGNKYLYQGYTPEIYTAGNIVTPNTLTDPEADNWMLWKWFLDVNAGPFNGAGQDTPLPLSYKSETSFPLLGNPLQVLSAEDAFTYVTANAGANAFLNENGESISNLDSLDQMYINNVIQGDCISYTSFSSYQDYPENQHYIDFHNSVSNIPINTGYTDSNSDGIPDAWVLSRGFGVNDDLTTYQWPSGYVGIEEFLNEIDANAIEVVEVTGVEVTPQSATINIPETVQLTYSIQPSDATNQNGVWTSSDETIVTVTSNGLVEPVSAGDVTITFTTNDGSFSDSALITVTNIIIPLESITISPNETVIDISESIQLNTIITPTNATYQNGTWSSTNENVAIVNENGLVTGLSEGITTITFTSDFDDTIVANAIINVVDIFFGTYELYNATTDELIDVIVDDTSFNLDVIGDQLNFRSIPQGGDLNPDVESVTVTWTGAENGSWSESVPIYAGMTNHIDLDFDPYTVIEGTYNFTITYYSEDSGQGTIIAADTFSITFFRGLSVTIEGDNSICEGETTTLVANTNLGVSYLWNTGETTPSIEVTPTGTTSYTVTVEDADGNFVEDTIEVTVNSIPSANAGPDTSICEGESVILSASGGTSYLWSTGDTTASIEVNPTITSQFSVEVFNGDCSDLDEVTVSVISAPQLTTSGNVTLIEGESTTLTVSGSDNYLWSTGETSDSITVSPIETTTYTVTSTNSNNCSTTEEIIVSIESLFEASAGTDQRICAQSGAEVILTSSSADSYLWSTGETNQSIVVSPLSTTTYTVTATSGIQEDTASVTVFVDPNPNVTIINGDSADILVGEFITLSATGANSYEWSNGATQPNIAVSPTQTTIYQVRGYINDCYEEEEIVVNVYEQVNAYAGEDVTICLDDSIVLTATGGDEYLWSTGETTQSIEVTPQETTQYTVTVFNPLDFDEATVTVEVDTDCEETIVEPTDNPTEFNFKVYPVPAVDYFTIDITGMTDDAELFLYDITGKLMLKEALISDNNYYSFTTEINVSNIRTGIYFLHLIEENNPNPEVIKIIIN